MVNRRMAYVVTSGEYSNYHIVAVFTDGGAAKDHVALRNESARYSWDRLRVEEFPLNGAAPQTFDMVVAVAQVPRDGAIRYLPTYPFPVWEYEDIEDEYGLGTDLTHLGNPPNDLIQVSVADRVDVAVKRLGEVATQIAADFDVFVDQIRTGRKAE